MKTFVSAFVLAITLLIQGCATIPPEAPQLSTQLGTRITALESGHMRLVEQFFFERRARVDNFVQTVWLDEFAKDFFADPKIDATWSEVVKSNQAEDRIKFITIVGPKIQAHVNKKRLELIRPIDDVEVAVKAKIKFEFDQVRAINNTLTSFLASAAKVDENRKRYLEMIGIEDKEVERIISETDDAVAALVSTAERVESRISSASTFRDKLVGILKTFRK
jgi:hypothetical protein